jgi:hypothetical protein
MFFHGALIRRGEGGGGEDTGGSEVVGVAPVAGDVEVEANDCGWMRGEMDSTSPRSSHSESESESDIQNLPKRGT